MELELDRTLEYWEKCRQLEPKFGTKTLRIIIDTLLSRVSALFVLNNSRLCSSTHIHIIHTQGQDKKASELLDQIQAEDTVPKQVQKHPF